ncbi:MAG: peptidoglycan editing factor PgeF [Eubacteriales bacterium]
MFYREQFGELVIEKSDIIEVPHAFSTRYGGVSSKDYLATLNVGENRGDSEENVLENIGRLLAPLGHSRKTAVLAKQVHSLNVRRVTPSDGGRMFEDTDGFVTDQKGIALMVKIADCVPILLWDPEGGVIAALHAGWRGSAGGIAGVGVRSMAALGADRRRIRAAIGACIHVCCYEVQNDFVDAMTALAGKELADGCITRRQGKIYADLPELNRRMLLLSGLSEENIDLNPACTCCHPDRYFSHRASGGQRGTMAAVISL